MIKIFFLFIAIIFATAQVTLARNTWNESLSKAKNILASIIYETENSRTTLYCNIPFSKDRIILPSGLDIEKYKNRAHKIEWEHVVPIENFGRTFIAWRDGAEYCIDKNGKHYKGRRCAEKVSSEFRYMQADMYNIYPVLGAINASRLNYSFTLLPHTKSNFGICSMKIEGRKAEPPPSARGKIARTYLYMQKTYPCFTMSKSQFELMCIWDKQYPVTKEECRRTKSIELMQENENLIIKNQCLAKGLW